MKKIFWLQYIWVNCSELSQESCELKTFMNISNKKINCGITPLKSQRKISPPVCFFN